MIKVEGYMAFEGVLRVKPKSKAIPYELTGQFLYKPDTNCWYGKGGSFPAEICEVIEDAGY